MDKNRTTPPDTAARPLVDGSEAKPGSLALEVKDGQGRLTLPAEISLPELRALQQTLLAGQGLPAGVVLDCSAVVRSDVFFLQLLLAARRNYARLSKPLTIAGPLPEDLRLACLVQGFGADEDDGLLPLAAQS